MTTHLSALQLDELAGSTGALADPHVTSCARCAAKLEALRAQSAAFLARPDTQALEAKLLGRHAATPPSRASRTLLLLAPLAASLLLFFLWPGGTETGAERVKGAPMVMLLDVKGEVVTSAKVGDELSLALRFTGSESRKVSVHSLDANGKRDELWKGSVAPNERAVISKFVVTPGNVEVVADFEPPASGSLRVGSAHDTARTRLELK